MNRRAFLILVPFPIKQIVDGLRKVADWIEHAFKWIGDKL